MSLELGVNVEEVLQSVDDLALVLGPEAEQFVDSLRALLSEPQEHRKK